MTSPLVTDTTAPSLREEIANSASHGVGLLASLAAAPILIVSASRHGDASSIAGVSIFAATLVVLYLASTLYHGLSANRTKRVFRVLDHCAIFLLIAGTYTPFALGVLRGAWGWTLIGLVWGLALAGIVLKATGLLHHPILSTALYVMMGWLALIAIRPILLRVPLPGVLWLLAGGLAYTVGVAFYAARRTRYAHLGWHLCVLAGSACHFIAVLRYAA